MTLDELIAESARLRGEAERLHEIAREITRRVEEMMTARQQGVRIGLAVDPPATSSD
jgi:hypothetical protein